MTPEHTDMTGAARLREALEFYAASVSYAPQNPPGTGSPIWRDAGRRAREALAAVPEAPEPVYVYRAASDVIKWIHRGTAGEARADLREVADEPTARWVERRGPWERVEEGTE